MVIFWSIVGGAVWGLLFAYINYRIMKKAIKEGDPNKLTSSSMARTMVDFACLAIAFFLQKFIPFNFMATIISAAVVLSTATLVVSIVLAKKTPEVQKEKNPDEN